MYNVFICSMYHMYYVIIFLFSRKAVFFMAKIYFIPMSCFELDLFTKFILIKKFHLDYFVEDYDYFSTGII